MLPNSLAGVGGGTNKSLQFSSGWHQRARSEVWDPHAGLLPDSSSSVYLSHKLQSLGIFLSNAGSTLKCPCGIGVPGLQGLSHCLSNEIVPTERILAPLKAPLTVPQGCTITAHCVVVTKAQHSQCQNENSKKGAKLLCWSGKHGEGRRVDQGRFLRREGL